MKKVIFISAICLLALFTTANSCYAQKCTSEKAEIFAPGFSKLKYCIEDLGWRESVKKNEWRVTVYNLYDDVDVRVEFNIVDPGAVRRGLGLHTIPRKGGSRSTSFYFTSEPEFVYGKIEVIEK